MTLADELRGVGIRRPTRSGMRRREFCVDESQAEARREARLRRKREKQRVWAKANPERVKMYRDLDRKKNPARIKAAKTRWRKENADHVRVYQARKMREWRRANPERAREAKRRFYLKHREIINRQRRERYAARRAAGLPGR